jgi:hypothetical protein
VKGADQRTIDAVVKAAVRCGGHARIEEHQAAAAAGTRLRRVAVAIALRNRHEHVGAAQIARVQEVLWLPGVVVAKILDALEPVGRNDRLHQ